MKIIIKRAVVILMIVFVLFSIPINENNKAEAAAPIVALPLPVIIAILIALGFGFLTLDQLQSMAMHIQAQLPKYEVPPGVSEEEWEDFTRRAEERIYGNIGHWMIDLDGNRFWKSSSGNNGEPDSEWNEFNDALATIAISKKILDAFDGLIKDILDVTEYDDIYDLTNIGLTGKLVIIDTELGLYPLQVHTWEVMTLNTGNSTPLQRYYEYNNVYTNGMYIQHFVMNGVTIDYVINLNGQAQVYGAGLPLTNIGQNGTIGNITSKMKMFLVADDNNNGRVRLGHIQQSSSTLLSTNDRNSLQLNFHLENKDGRETWYSRPESLALPFNINGYGNRTVTKERLEDYEEWEEFWENDDVVLLVPEQISEWMYGRKQANKTEEDDEEKKKEYVPIPLEDINWRTVLKPETEPGTGTGTEPGTGTGAKPGEGLQEPGTGEPTDPHKPPTEQSRRLVFTLFPFCLPWDVVYFIDAISAEEVEPVFEIDIFPRSMVDGKLNLPDMTIILDFKEYEVPRQILRNGLLIGFIVVIMVISKRYIWTGGG